MSIHTLQRSALQQPITNPATRRRLALQRNTPASAALTPRALTHRATIARWALANGRPLNLATLTLVLGAKLRWVSQHGDSFTTWTDRRLEEFVRMAVPIWAHDCGTSVPHDTADTLRLYLEALADAEALSDESSDLQSLLEMLTHVSRLTEDGRRSRHPAMRHRRRSPVGGNKDRSTKI